MYLVAAVWTWRDCGEGGWLGGSWTLSLHLERRPSYVSSWRPKVEKWRGAMVLTLAHHDPHTRREAYVVAYDFNVAKVRETCEALQTLRPRGVEIPCSARAAAMPCSVAMPSA